MSTEFYLIAVALVTVLSASRLTRLAVNDDFPPVKFIRDRVYHFLDKTERRLQWQSITWCGYCASPWLTLLVVGWGLLAHVYGHPPNDLSVAQHIWWAFNGTAAGAYLAAIIMANDGDDGDDN